VSGKLRIEIASGPVWMNHEPATTSVTEHASGEWSLVIERWQVLGRLGWQRITEKYRMP
jgi:hypothetical protein